MGRRGVTLVELLIVMIVLSSLMAMSGVAYVKILKRRQIARARLFANAMAQACELYRSDWRRYPLVQDAAVFSLDELCRCVAEPSGRRGPYIEIKELDGQLYSSVDEVKRAEIVLDPFPNGRRTNFYICDMVIRFPGDDLKPDTADDRVEYWCTHPNDAKERAPIRDGRPVARAARDGAETHPPKPFLSSERHIAYSPPGAAPSAGGRAEQMRFYSAGPDGRFDTPDDIFAGR